MTGEFQDKIQASLAAEISLIADFNEVRFGPLPDELDAEFQREVRRVIKKRFRAEELARMYAAGGPGAIMRYIADADRRVLWLMVSDPEDHDLWHVMDWRCPECGTDTLQMVDEHSFRCASCARSLDDFERHQEA